LGLISKVQYLCGYDKSVSRRLINDRGSSPFLPIWHWNPKQINLGRMWFK
jgi:hypothetical protein